LLLISYWLLFIKNCWWTVGMSLEFFNGSLKFHYGLYTLIGLLLLDLIGAISYLVEHKTKFLWRFHLIHHTDTWDDTTRLNRHHPEKVIRFTLQLWSVNCGKSYVDGISYQTLSVIATQFNHATLPYQKWDTIMSYLIVQTCTKHHHYKLPYTDSNYGNIFSVWDRLFGTFRTLPKKKLYMELTHEEWRTQWIEEFIENSFQKQRSQKNYL
jgi:sterol desaturase/sphingolipid hydroxylase (fatty acid hydroxylase superfamily)